MKNCLIVRLSLELNADTVATHMQTQWPGYSWPAYVSLKEHQRCWQSLARYCRYSTSALHHISWSKAIMILKKWSPSSCTTFITYSLHLSNCTTLMRRQMPNLTQHIIDNQHLSSVELQFSDIHDCLIVVDHWFGMSCPSWQWHRTTVGHNFKPYRWHCGSLVMWPGMLFKSSSHIKAEVKFCLY